MDTSSFAWSLEALNAPQRLSFEDRSVITQFVVASAEKNAADAFTKHLERLDTREEAEELMGLLASSSDPASLEEMTNTIIARRPASVGYKRSSKRNKRANRDRDGTDEQNEENEKEAKMGEQKQEKKQQLTLADFTWPASVTSDGSLTPEDVEYVQTFLLDVSNVTPEQITIILGAISGLSFRADAERIISVARDGGSKKEISNACRTIVKERTSPKDELEDSKEQHNPDAKRERAIRNVCLEKNVERMQKHLNLASHPTVCARRLIMKTKDDSEVGAILEAWIARESAATLREVASSEFIKVDGERLAKVIQETKLPPELVMPAVEACSGNAKTHAERIDIISNFFDSVLATDVEEVIPPLVDDERRDAALATLDKLKLHFGVDMTRSVAAAIKMATTWGQLSEVLGAFISGRDEDQITAFATDTHADEIHPHHTAMLKEHIRTSTMMECQPPTLHEEICYKLDQASTTYELTLVLIEILEDYAKVICKVEEEGPESLKYTQGQLDKVVYVKIPKHIQQRQTQDANMDSESGRPYRPPQSPTGGERRLRIFDETSRSMTLKLLKEIDQQRFGITPESAKLVCEAMQSERTLSRATATLMALLRPGIAAEQKVKQLKAAMDPCRKASDSLGDVEKRVLAEIVADASAKGILTPLAAEGASRQVKSATDKIDGLEIIHVMMSAASMTRQRYSRIASYNGTVTSESLFQVAKPGQGPVNASMGFFSDDYLEEQTVAPPSNAKTTPTMNFRAGRKFIEKSREPLPGAAKWCKSGHDYIEVPGKFIMFCRRCAQIKNVSKTSRKTGNLPQI
eukprot:g5199.t1